MKTIIKIVLALVVLTAAAQAGMASLTNYQFQDAIHESLLFDPRASEAEIIEMVVKLGSEHGLSVEAGNVTVREVGSDLIVSATYTREVNLLPGFYAREWTFNPSTSTRFLTKSRR